MQMGLTLADPRMGACLSPSSHVCPGGPYLSIEDEVAALSDAPQDVVVLLQVTHSHELEALAPVAMHGSKQSERQPLMMDHRGDETFIPGIRDHVWQVDPSIAVGERAGQGRGSIYLLT